MLNTHLFISEGRDLESYIFKLLRLMPNSVVEAIDSPPVSQRDWRLGDKYDIGLIAKCLQHYRRHPLFVPNLSTPTGPRCGV